MPKKPRAIEVIPNKLWITYGDNDVKTGTMSPASDDPSMLVQFFTDGSNVAHDRDNINELFDFQEKSEPSSWHQAHVFGYPISDIKPFKIQECDNLPCFTKSATSTVYFAAGYYGINFTNGGWMESHCPKLSTLHKYEFIGPFKTQTDMQIAIQRRKRNDG